jgi:predicted permease
LFTVGVRLFNKPEEKNGTWKSIALNPAIIAIVLGIACFLTQLHPPWPVTDAASMMGGMTSPISMLLVGSILAKGKLRALLNDWRIVPVMAARLLVVPLGAFFVLRLFVHNTVMLGVLVILSAMPVAAITSIFAERYGGDTALASKLVVLSTLLCVATVPLISLLLKI